MRSYALLAALVAVFNTSSNAHAEAFRCPDGAADSGERSGMVVRWCEVSRDGRLLYHGPVWRWHRNGRLAGKEYYLNGNGEGSWQSWQENGKPASTGTFKAGRKIGLWKYWDSAGRLKTEVNYATGGNRWTEYYASGRKRTTGAALTSGKIGAWIYWNPDGTKKAECDFRDGLFVLPSPECKTIADEVAPVGFSRPIPAARVAQNGTIEVKVGPQAYQLTVPTDWVADTEAGKPEQVPLVLVPRGGAWRKQGTPQMYLRVVFPDGRSFGETVAGEREAFEANVAEYREHSVTHGRLSTGRDFLVKKVSYKPLSATDSPFSIVANESIREAVAFLHVSDQVVLVAVLACETETQLKDATHHLTGLIDSVSTQARR
jgi:hypothetical protein